MASARPPRLLVRCSDSVAPLPDVAACPPDPSPGVTLAAVRARLMRETDHLELLTALAHADHPDVRSELSSSIADLYTRMSRDRRGIELVDRVARDRPERAEVWFGRGCWVQGGALVA